MTTDADYPPLIDVEVPRDVARHAARIADEHDIAFEDALARLTMFDYPTDVVPKPAGDTHSNSGP